MQDDGIHQHPQPQLVSVLGGRVSFSIDGKEMSISNGDSLLIESNQPHGCIPLPIPGILLDIFTLIREAFLPKKGGAIKMIRIGARGHDLSQVDTPQKLASELKKRGIHNVQLALNQSFPEMSRAQSLNPGMGTYFQQVFAKEEIQVALLSCYSNLIHPDDEKREEILKKFEQYLFMAPYFQASMVASETGSVLGEMGYSEGNFTDEVFLDLIQVVKRLVKTGEQYGTMVGIEGGLNHPLYSIDRVAQLVQAIPSNYLGIILDPTNLITVDTHHSIVEMVEEAFQRFGEKIVCLHLKDYVVENGQIVPVMLGDGWIPYKEILTIVSQYKPYCYVILEETKDDGFDRAQELLKDFLI